MNEQKNDGDINIRNILSKNLLDYLDDSCKDIQTSYDISYNDQGLYLTRTICQFISHAQLKEIEENKDHLIKSNASVNNSKKTANNNKESSNDLNNNNESSNDLNNNKESSNDLNNNKEVTDIGLKVQDNSQKLDIICDILLNKEPCIATSKESSNSSGEIILTPTQTIPLPCKDQKTGVECGLYPIENIPSILQDEESTFYESSSQESILTQSASLEQVLQDHIEKVLKIYKVPPQDDHDIDFYKTVTEDTVGYIKDLYIEKLHDVYNKLNDINERKIDFMLLLRKKYEFYWFSSAGSCLILFNRLDSIFVSAWQDYLDYLAEFDILFKTDKLKGFFKFKSL
ncbi:hypothetical protein P3W45_000597 [Vairimorpha bombi]